LHDIHFREEVNMAPALAEPREREPEDRVAKAIANAKFKNARLRLMKARNELYLAERREEEPDEMDEDETKEL
jgi:hypothetical protein